MISRKSARLIAELYEQEFTSIALPNLQQTCGRVTQWSKLYEFLYDLEYDSAFLEWLEKSVRTGVVLKDFIMRIHTGESLNAITIKLSKAEKAARAQELLRILARDILNLFNSKIRPQLLTPTATARGEMLRIVNAMNESQQRPFQIVDRLKSQLELDGYVLRDEQLYYSESAIVPDREEQTYLRSLVAKLPIANKEVITNHLERTEDHYTNKMWGDSISNARNFLEEILNQVVRYIHKEKKLTSQIPAQARGRRDFLECHGFLDQKEKDAIDKFYGMISDRGSHPNIAEQDEARLMRYIALTFSQYIPLKLEKYIET